MDNPNKPLARDPKHKGKLDIQRNPKGPLKTYILQKRRHNNNTN